IILAAGPSRRLGKPKQLLPWGGPTLLGTVVAQTLAWPVDSVWVVLGSRFEEVLQSVDLGDAGVVENPEWEEGMASSLRVGLDVASRDPSTEAALIVMGDQPGIDPAVVDALLEHRKTSDALAVVPKYRYVRGHPVLIARTLWSRLMSLEGDQGGRDLLQAHPEWVEEVIFEQLAPRDVDTSDDVKDLQPREQ
ncbi:MAG: nucleotidyltransferase family protein, partial [Acidimicrobiia bacterium]|nr:nucleotidyltransferase family protein [Acidimicrobiia bacterium]